MTEKNKFEWEHTHIFLDELTIIAQEKIENLGDFLQELFACETLKNY